jgi:UDP-N-acetylmuramyl pentapeptide synthase
MRGMVAHLAQSLDEIAQLISQAKAGDAILVKGSRSLELEKAVEMARSTGAQP